MTPTPSDIAGYETLKNLEEADAFNQWMFEAILPDISGRVLEIGSGTGNLSECLFKAGFESTLTEMDPGYVELLNKRFPGKQEDIVQMDLTDPEFKTRFRQMEGSYHTVVALNVIEHIEDHQKALEHCAWLLKKGGKMIMLVPAYQSLYNNFDKELSHFRRYSPEKTRKLFAPDFSDIRTRYFNLAGIPGWWLFGAVLKRKLIPGQPLKIFNALVPLFRLADRLTLKKFGLSLITVGSKK